MTNAEQTKLAAEALEDIKHLSRSEQKVVLRHRLVQDLKAFLESPNSVGNKEALFKNVSGYQDLCKSTL